MVIFKSIHVLLYGCFTVLFSLGGKIFLQILGISVAIWGDLECTEEEAGLLLKVLRQWFAVYHTVAAGLMW
jgi:hypothetical protein